MTTAQKIRKAYRLAKLIKQCEDSRKAILSELASEEGYTLGAINADVYASHETAKVQGGEHTLSIERGLSSSLDKTALLAVGVQQATLDACTRVSYYLKGVVR